MNIYDIANESGVSITTVSRVLNDRNNVSEKTKEKVRAVLKKYNYTPNGMARGLVSKSMKSIGVLTTDIREPHHAETAYIIEQEFRNLGYNVILCNTGGEPSKNLEYIKVLVEKNVDGIILLGSVFSADSAISSVLAHANKIPLVIANGFLDIENSYSVLVDDSYGITLCVDHLVEKGHSDIVYVIDACTYSGERQRDGFIMAMKNHDLKIDDNSIITVDGGLKGGYEAVEKFIGLNKKFTAIVFGEDLTALGGIKKLKELGMNVPGDVAVTGFNNSIFSICSDPELTTIDNKVETMGSLTVKLLHDLIEDKNATSNILIRPELVIRAST